MRAETDLSIPQSWYVEDTQKYLLSDQKKLQSRFGGWNLLKSFASMLKLFGNSYSTSTIKEYPSRRPAYTDLVCLPLQQHLF